MVFGRYLGLKRDLAVWLDLGAWRRFLLKSFSRRRLWLWCGIILGKFFMVSSFWNCEIRLKAIRAIPKKLHLRPKKLHLRPKNCILAKSRQDIGQRGVLAVWLDSGVPSKFSPKFAILPPPVSQKQVPLADFRLKRCFFKVCFSVCVCALVFSLKVREYLSRFTFFSYFMFFPLCVCVSACISCPVLSNYY